MSIALEAEPALVDIHCHVIPGVDDGARNLGDALAALEAMHAQGVRRVIATPHFDAELVGREPRYTQRLEKIDAAWELLRPAAAERLPELELKRGHEVMLDTPRPVLAEPRLRLGGGPYVLVEFPRLFVPAGATDVLYHIRMEGYVPIVAHPERYTTGAQGNLGLVEEWRRVGARMIVNAGSLAGGFGKDAHKIAVALLRHGWVDLIGSDYHARPSRPLLLRKAYEQVAAWGGAEQARLLLSDNPARVFDDRELLEVPPLEVRAGLWGRLRRLLGG